MHYSPVTGMPIGQIGKLTLWYAIDEPEGVHHYTLRIPLLDLEAPLLLDELPSFGNLKASEIRTSVHPILKIFSSIFPESPIGWMGKYEGAIAPHYLIELPESATRPQVFKMIRELNREIGRNTPQAPRPKVAAGTRWNQFFDWMPRLWPRSLQW